MEYAISFTITRFVNGLAGMLLALGLVVPLVPANAQCFGGFQFPSATIVPDDTGIATTISTASFAGDRARISLIAGRTYRFTSSVPADFITVSETATSGALVFGTQPLFFTATVTQDHFVHFHTNSACGTQNSARTTTVTRTYCAAGANSCGGGDESILKVSMGGINNSSGGCGGNGYSDFSQQVTGVFTGQAETITVTNSNGFSGDQVRVFVDWNRNFSLSDAGEEFILTTTDNLSFTGSITAPPGTLPGNVRMRVRLMFLGTVQPCGFTSIGEVEDYTLNVGTFGNGVYEGGTGRGDAQATITPAPIASSIYEGGSGRGDVTAAITPAPIASSIYAGGSGRGDIQARFVVGLFDLCEEPDTVSVFPFGTCAPTLGTTAEATQDGDPPNCDSDGSWPDVWFTVNTGPNSTLIVTVEKGTAQDIVFQVLTGACPGQSIGCGILSSGPFSLPVAVTPFTDVRIRVMTNTLFGLPGTFTLCVTEPEPVRLALRAFLEGPYNATTGLMNDALRSSGLVPLAEPYTTLGYAFTG
ncbi:MAG TPA: GEVED domain-containing protein, partial [Flavobacteriales bacterium]|nr:GEVED domain-containing protein [Flavobacteriales bacterium]HMR29234.1 GEVED domain-containing protein [Flavobacteriales bacterium]